MTFEPIAPTGWVKFGEVKVSGRDCQDFGRRHVDF